MYFFIVKLLPLGTAFFIPDMEWNEPQAPLVFFFSDKDKNSRQKPYVRLAKELEEAGIDLFVLDIQWDKHKNLSECTLEATKKVQEIIRELQPLSYYLGGIGVGAMIAAQVGYIFRAKALLLCSMKPFFKEEIPLLSWGWRYHAKRKIYRGQNKPGYPATRIEIPTYFVEGEKEKNCLNEKVSAARKACFALSQWHIIPKSSGKLSSKNYRNGLKEGLLNMVGFSEKEQV